jgi:hypothetical protein
MRQVNKKFAKARSHQMTGVKDEQKKPQANAAASDDTQTHDDNLENE